MNSGSSGELNSSGSSESRLSVDNAPAGVGAHGQSSSMRQWEYLAELLRERVTRKKDEMCTQTKGVEVLSPESPFRITGTFLVTPEADAIIEASQRLEIRERGLVWGYVGPLDPGKDGIYPLEYLGLETVTLRNIHELRTLADQLFARHDAGKWTYDPAEKNFSRTSSQLKKCVMEVASNTTAIIQDIVQFVDEEDAPFDLRAAQKTADGIYRIICPQKKPVDIPINSAYGLGHLAKLFYEDWFPAQFATDDQGRIHRGEWSAMMVPAVSPTLVFSRYVIRKEQLTTPDAIQITKVGK